MERNQYFRLYHFLYQSISSFKFSYLQHQPHRQIRCLKEDYTIFLPITNIKMKNIAWTFIMLLTGACAESPTDPIFEPNSKKGEVEQLTKSTFTLKTGETVRDPSSGLSITLTEVNDSRCPADAICITGGEASTSLKVASTQNSSQTTDLKLCLGCPDINDSIEFGLEDQKYLLILKEVTPYPFASQPETLKNKTAELLIQQAE